MEEYKRFTISLQQNLYEKFEEFRNKIGLSRSDAIRKAMNHFMIQDENISASSDNVVGCITLMMTHQHFNLTENHIHEHLKNSKVKMSDRGDLSFIVLIAVKKDFVQLISYS